MFDYRSNQCNGENIFALGSLMLWHCWIIVIFKHSAHDIPICNMILLTWWCWLAGWMSSSGSGSVIIFGVKSFSFNWDNTQLMTSLVVQQEATPFVTWYCWLGDASGWLDVPFYPPDQSLIPYIIGFTPPFYAHCIASKPNAVHFLHHLIVIFIINTKCTPKLAYEGNSCGIISIWKLYSALPW